MPRIDGLEVHAEFQSVIKCLLKSIHVYEDSYYVTQMGVVVEKLARKKGQLPPSLSTEKPKIVGPPVLFIAPSGRPH